MTSSFYAQFVGAIANFFFESPLGTVLSDVTCLGNETELLECSATVLPMQCESDQNVSNVVCQDIDSTEFSDCDDGDIRLVDGTNPLEGRIELCLNNAWGTVCDTEFSEDVSDVICSQLQLPHNGKKYLVLVHHK